ncbi:hypothetical protein F25303_6422 [Fusarium sp. NRRL 25303]|nr:hypothetical protein F25303_6422 [Fusarium sp. NRRL 25303]
MAIYQDVDDITRTISNKFCIEYLKTLVTSLVMVQNAQKPVSYKHIRNDKIDYAVRTVATWMVIFQEVSNRLYNIAVYIEDFCRRRSSINGLMGTLLPDVVYMDLETGVPGTELPVVSGEAPPKTENGADKHQITTEGDIESADLRHHPRLTFRSAATMKMGSVVKSTPDRNTAQVRSLLKHAGPKEIRISRETKVSEDNVHNTEHFMEAPNVQNHHVSHNNMVEIE